MKKTQQAIISILSFIIILTFTGSAFAEDSCNIVWWTDSSDCSDCDYNWDYMTWDCSSCLTYDPSGSAPTAEISRTQAAAAEVYSNILFENPSWTGTCYNYYEEDSSGVFLPLYGHTYDPLYEEYNACLDGSWSYSRSGYSSAWEFLEEANGGWDVTCGDEDIDRDAVPDGTDNCPSIFNPDQSDVDSDGLGDVCDSCPNDSLNDADGDSLCGDVDNCPEDPNPEQADNDSDGIGNVCDICPDNVINDPDEDGVCSDNCPTVFNPDQADSDGDGIGDICENCNIVWWTDSSNCTACVYSNDPWNPWPYDCWSCTFEPSGSTETLEISRTQATALEVFLNIMEFSPLSWTDSCYDGGTGYSGGDDYSVCLDGTWNHIQYGEFIDQKSASGGWDVICENGDIDGDGVLDGTDNCPNDSNPGQEDVDSNGTGDICDANTVYGYIKDIEGAAIDDVDVVIVRVSCGNAIVVEASTNALGYYAYGDLGSGYTYFFSASKPLYSFAPTRGSVTIPQTEIQPYDFTATAN